MFKLILVLSLFACSEAAVTYQLYTRMNTYNGQPLVYQNLQSVERSNFNGAKKTYMLIHGYKQSGRSRFNRDIKDALLVKDDYNVIVVDWSREKGKSYTSARMAIEPVGRSVAQFVDWLQIGRSRVVGFDLGAHIAGVRQICLL